MNYGVGGVKQTLEKQGRHVCPRLAFIGQNKGSVHPKLLSIWDTVHRSARITFPILWDASSGKWQQAAEERRSVMWMWQSPLTARTESRSMKRWRSARDGGEKLEQMCGIKKSIPAGAGARRPFCHPKLFAVMQWQHPSRMFCSFFFPLII